ncbi:MAG: serine O-acetyltransferase [Laribacter sp.]|nr:serine O-acetyltransferase [Laribacter sp.]MBP9608370.1 serine O-acetyltransferase [Laribacter sp.]
MLTTDPLWQAIRDEVVRSAEREPLLASFLHMTVLRHASFEDMLAFHLSSKLACNVMDGRALVELLHEAFTEDPHIVEAARADLTACYDRDPACEAYSTPLLYYKGYHALQCYRVTHWLWGAGRDALALFLQNRISESMGVDIHPAARFGEGILLDHATGFVAGETAVVGNNVSILQGVTLGGTGKQSGDRHPKIGAGVLLGAGAKILGNIHLGEGVKVGAGSVVLSDVPPHVTVAGVPARIVGQTAESMPALEMNHRIDYP